jgi:hypothetical protein
MEGVKIIHERLRFVQRARHGLKPKRLYSSLTLTRFKIQAWIHEHGDEIADDIGDQPQ